MQQALGCTRLVASCQALRCTQLVSGRQVLGCAQCAVGLRGCNQSAKLVFARRLRRQVLGHTQCAELISAPHTLGCARLVSGRRALGCAAYLFSCRQPSDAPGPWIRPAGCWPPSPRMRLVGLRASSSRMRLVALRATSYWMRPVCPGGLRLPIPQMHHLVSGRRILGCVQSTQLVSVHQALG